MSAKFALRVAKVQYCNEAGSATPGGKCLLILCVCVRACVRVCVFILAFLCFVFVVVAAAWLFVFMCVCVWGGGGGGGGVHNMRKGSLCCKFLFI